MKDLSFVVIGKSFSDTKLLAKVRGFTVIVDEPSEIGGSDKGPTPLEYLLIALAGCLNITFRKIAAERGVNISSLEFVMKGTLNPSKFQGIPTKERAGYKEITVLVKLNSDAPKETLMEILKEAEKRCPVSDNLIMPTPLKIEVKKL